jgi:hypothetical protein
MATLAETLVSKLSAFDETWVCNPAIRDKALWYDIRRNAAARVRQELTEIVGDLSHPLTCEQYLLRYIRALARNIYNYRGSMCSGETHLRFELKLFCALAALRELNPNSTEELCAIAAAESCPEIEKLWAGESVR